MFFFQGIRGTPALASAETLYGGIDLHHPSPPLPPQPPTRSTETLYGFLPLVAPNGCSGEFQHFSGAEVPPFSGNAESNMSFGGGRFPPGARTNGGNNLSPITAFPPRNTLERKRIHFNPFEEYSD
jgi:hypothetical protein